MFQYRHFARAKTSSPLERRRPRQSHPEGSQGGVREAAVSGNYAAGTPGVVRVECCVGQSSVDSALLGMADLKSVEGWGCGIPRLAKYARHGAPGSVTESEMIRGGDFCSGLGRSRRVWGASTA
jgi:hypothetical protein